MNSHGIQPMKIPRLTDVALTPPFLSDCDFEFWWKELD